MNPREQPYDETFETRLEQIEREFRKLRQKIETLTQENERLKAEINQQKEHNDLSLEQYSETERLAMRQHILGLIEKIDHYLDGSAS